MAQNNADESDANERKPVEIFHTIFGDRTEDDTAKLADDIRHEIGFTDDRETVTPAEFKQAYVHVGSDEAASLSDLWHRWNADHSPSEAFIDAEARSLAVGDVVRFDGNAYLCESIGWSRAPSLDEVTADAAAATEVA